MLIIYLLLPNLVNIDATKFEVSITKNSWQLTVTSHKETLLRNTYRRKIIQVRKNITVTAINPFILFKNFPATFRVQLHHFQAIILSVNLFSVHLFVCFLACWRWCFSYCYVLLLYSHFMFLRGDISAQILYFLDIIILYIHDIFLFFVFQFASIY